MTSSGLTRYYRLVSQWDRSGLGWGGGDGWEENPSTDTLGLPWAENVHTSVNYLEPTFPRENTLLSEERDVNQAKAARGEKIIKALRTGTISLLPSSFSVLIQKSRFSTLANLGALISRPGSGVGPGGRLSHPHTLPLHMEPFLPRHPNTP